jgi:ribosomal protein S12 methylthiotransferase accessory factor
MAAEHLIDSRAGIIRYVSELPREAGAPNLFHFVAKSASADDAAYALSGGASTDRSTALAKAIGEVVERYCAGLLDRESSRFACYDDAPFPCADPASFALYSEEQLRQPGFPFAAFGRRTPVLWVEGEDLATGEACHVPAARVALPYLPDRERGERLITQPISTGLAAHSTLEDAAVNALCEVVERDAFMIVWQARITMPRIRLESLDERGRDLVGRFACCGGDVSLVNITLDHGIPTVLSALRSSVPGAPAVVFAAAADPSPRVAAAKSLEELELMRSFARYVRKEKQSSIGPGANGDTVRTREDHVHYHCHAEHAEASRFVFASTETIDLDAIPGFATGDPRRDLATLARRIAAVGERPIVVELTSPDVGALGLRVVRAVVPGFHPLVFGHRLRALGGLRLWTVPQALGYPGVSPRGGDNPAPHPFP